MPRYNVDRLISTIEQQVQLTNSASVSEFSLQSNAQQHEPVVVLPQTNQIFQQTLFPELSRHISVNKQMPNARFGLLKKIYLKCFSPFLNRQATFNSQTAKVLELFNQHLDATRLQLQARDAAFQQEQQRTTRLMQNLEEVEEVLDYLFHQNIETGNTVNSLRDTMSDIESGLHQLTKQVQKLTEQHSELTQLIGGQKAEQEKRASRQQELIQLQDQKLANHEQLLTKQQQLFSAQEQLVSALGENLSSVERQLYDLQNHSNFSDGLFQDFRKRQDQLQTSLQHLEGHSHGLEWVGEAYQSMEQRIGATEARAEALNIRLREVQEFKALVSELNQNLKQAPQVTSEETNTVRAANAVEAFNSSTRDLAYHEFQLLHRGSEEHLKASQQFYVQLIEQSLGTGHKLNALDLGCGDGVFVELLTEQGWNAVGVDKNQSMIRAGLKNGLNLHEQDLFKFLSQAEPNSYEVISAFQVIEHLKSEWLERLLAQSLRALSPGGLLLLETINPKTICAHKWFHMDLTHEKLILPETLQWMSETVGFEVVKWKGIHPVEEEQRLENPNGDANVEKLNEFLFGDQDYYFLARKPKAVQSTI